MIRKLPSLILTFHIAGFLAVSYIASSFHFDSRTVTLPFRALELALIVATLMSIWRYASLKITTSTILATAFIVMYSLRIIYDEFFVGILVANLSPWEVMLYFFGISLPAFAIFFLIRDIYSYRQALPWTLCIVGLCCALSFWLTPARAIRMKGNYTGNDVLNHIAFGHMGLTGCLLGLFIFLNIGRKYSFRLRVVALGAIVLSAFAMISSASRGALAAGGLLLFPMLCLALLRGSKRMTVLFIFGAVVLGASVLTFLGEKGIKYNPLSANDRSTYVRELLFRDAWNEYLESPIVGSSFLEKNEGTYPHNMVVESFMATGTFGGATLCLLLLIASRRAVALMRRAPEMAWIPLCFFQYVIGAMFSGGLYGNTLFWALLGIMLGVDVPRLIFFRYFDRHGHTRRTSMVAP